MRSILDGNVAPFKFGFINFSLKLEYLLFLFECFVLKFEYFILKCENLYLKFSIYFLKLWYRVAFEIRCFYWFVFHGRILLRNDNDDLF